MAFFEIGYPENLESFPNVKRSFGDIAGATILGDVGVMAIGYMIVFVYVILMLGKFNCLELRSHLSFAGIMGVIMGIVVSYGFCSAINLFFGPMHSVLPFLLLGIDRNKPGQAQPNRTYTMTERKIATPLFCMLFHWSNIFDFTTRTTPLFKSFKYLV